MLLSAVSVLVIAQSSSEIPEGLMNNPVVFGRKYMPNFVPGVGVGVLLYILNTTPEMER